MLSREVYEGTKSPDVGRMNNNKATVKIGPIDAIPTKPKLSSCAFLPPLTIAIPAPNERINGTVAEPVVTPPLSKINGKNDFLESSITTNMRIKNVMK